MVDDLNKLRLMLVGGVFAVMGLLFALKPDWMIKTQIWFDKVILDAKFIPSKKTTFVFRIMGVLFIILSAVMVYAGYYMFIQP